MPFTTSTFQGEKILNKTMYNVTFSLKRALLTNQGQVKINNLKVSSKHEMTVWAYAGHNLSVLDFPSCRKEKIIRKDLEGLIQCYADTYVPRP